MKVLVNKGVECCIEIQFSNDSHAITPEMAMQLVIELEKALEDVDPRENLKEFWSGK